MDEDTAGNDDEKGHCGKRSSPTSLAAADLIDPGAAKPQPLLIFVVTFILFILI